MFTQIKQVMMHSAARSILAVDSSKFDRIAFSRLCDVKDMQTIIMDRKPEDRWLSFLDRCGVECIYPKEGD
ncbi:MAG: DeoR/GlpR transcriptional regulator, partial [Lachnospiraceae bacterium]|nr:DeoR/GlpR transcriptional regulator [Lachnospiraceae bacterium]